jgi:predicted nuclease with RNAse H fold
MSFSAKIWIGADPGGTGNFGLAILKSDGSVHTCCVNCADEAIDVVKERVKIQPAGVGVDSPLWWSSGPSGDRQADQWLRRTYGLSGGQVQTANSLRGAALVQGAMFVHRVRQLFPDVGVTETHPKAVWTILKVDNWNSFSTQFLLNVTIHAEQKHERDAIISAVAAREGFEGRWLKDLSTARHPSEQDPSQFWLAPIHYFWPDK